MIDFIKWGLKCYYAPPKIYDIICAVLKEPGLTDEERKELLRQKEIAKEMAIKTSILFPFEPEDD